VDLDATEEAGARGVLDLGELRYFAGLGTTAEGIRSGP
jgi:hypothetical protein